jgi:hypothetical protein
LEQGGYHWTGNTNFKVKYTWDTEVRKMGNYSV